MTLLSLVIVVAASQYFRLDPDLYFEQQRAVYVARQGVLVLHITGAVIALTMLPLQFAAFVRDRWPRTHRVSGRLYVLGVISGGIGGLLLSTTAYAGPVARLGFAGLAVAWLATTIVALRAILARDVPRHRRWMILSGSLTFAAVTLRLYLGVYFALNGSGVLDASFAQAYAAIAWLCWIPNLAIAWWLTRSRNEAGTENGLPDPRPRSDTQEHAISG
jgi:uncharacterized membrane protein